MICRKTFLAICIVALILVSINCELPSAGDPTVNNQTEYTVSFESNEGTAVPQQSIESGGKITEPTAPTRPEHTFVGWFKESTLETAWDFDADTVSGDMTLYAKWEAAGLYVYFDANGGSGSLDPILCTAGESKELPFNNTQITREGYKFISWNTVPDRVGGTEYRQQADVTLTSSNLTLYAQWVKLYDIGDTGPGGGLVFYSKDLSSIWTYPEWVYKEAAPAETQSVEKWGPWYLDVSAPTYGEGLENTQTLVASSTETDAAHYCADLSYGGYSDWFLPSRTELIWMAENLHKNGLGNFNDTDYSGAYWSSSIRSEDKRYAYIVIFNLSIYTDENILASALNPQPNGNDYQVRAARRF